MGVDSGLPDFRGPQGFWKAYPAYEHLGLDFADLANPRWFSEDPELAWGFYGHRLHLYRNIAPHGGFEILWRWAQDRTTTIFTSNVDGQFQKAGLHTRALFTMAHVNDAGDLSRALAPTGAGGTGKLSSGEAVADTMLGMYAEVGYEIPTPIQLAGAVVIVSGLTVARLARPG